MGIVLWGSLIAIRLMRVDIFWSWEECWKSKWRYSCLLRSCTAFYNRWSYKDTQFSETASRSLTFKWNLHTTDRFAYLSSHFKSRWTRRGGLPTRSIAAASSKKPWILSPRQVVADTRRFSSYLYFHISQNSFIICQRSRKTYIHIRMPRPLQINRSSVSLQYSIRAN